MVLTSFLLVVYLEANASDHKKGQVNNTGNNNITNICQPQVKVVQKQCKEYNSCEKPKTVYKTKYKTKWKTKWKTKLRTKIRTIKKIVHKPKKNRLRLLGGFGPTGVSAEVSGSKAVANEETGLVLGAGYDRMLNDTWSIGGQIQTNKTFLLGLGYDF